MNRTARTLVRRRRDPVRQRFMGLRDRRGLAISLVIFAVLVIAVVTAIYQHSAGKAKQIVDVELSGSAAQIADIVSRHGGAGIYRHALYVDFGFIAGYTVALVVAALVGFQLASTAFGRRAFAAAMAATAVAALLDCGENIALLLVLHRTPATNNGAAVAAMACAFAKFVLLLPAALVAAGAVLTTLWRGVVLRRLEKTSSRQEELSALRKRAVDRMPARDPDPSIRLRSPVGQRRAAWLANSNLPTGRRHGNIGFCVSGGGIRSATFALGALGTLRDELVKADYLVSVSGGGYATGAMQLALMKAREVELLKQPIDSLEFELDHLRTSTQPATEHEPHVRQARIDHLTERLGEQRAKLNSKISREAWQSVAEPNDVYEPGSPELDHTRRHGRYLADSASEWLKAIGTITRGVLVNLLIISVVLVLSARLLAHAYASFPDALLVQKHFRVPSGIAWAAAIPAAIALLLWALSVLIDPAPVRKRESARVRRTRAAQAALRPAAAAAISFALAITVFGVVIPLLSFLCQETPSSNLTVTGLPTSAAGSLLAAFVSVCTNPKSRASALADVKKATAWYGKLPGAQRSLAARSGVLVGALALAGGLLLLFGVVLATTGPLTGRSSWPGGYKEWQVTAAFAIILLFFLAADQVRWSLHGFYRRRLATAFAVRRMCNRDGIVEAQAYGDEITPLAGWTKVGEPDYAARVYGFPRLIFACSAHVSGQKVTPPGRQVLGWTMSSDYIGSPLMGWLDTEGTYCGVSPTIQKDLTVEAAQAISGAAIASQMGRMQRGYSKLLTLTNVRLGSWLPNPTYLDEFAADPAWWRARIPRRRYLDTLAKELFGHFPNDAPLVFVTDGGHYDNLGLIELLRHRCKKVVCIDASGDHGDVAATLAQAVQLAYEELGVEIKLDQPEEVTTAGKSDIPDDLLKELDARVKRACVIKGTITYPDLGGDLPRETADFILGKAVLTADMPFDVLAYASSDASFPNDSTADQWYDADRFDSYYALGRFVGRQVRSRLPWGPVDVPGQTTGSSDEAAAQAQGAS